LLLEWGAGNKEALESLMPLIYDELLAIAGRHLRKERVSHTLQRTALVNEVYLRVVDQTQVSWSNRAQFLAVASQMMRRILVDHARKHLSGKRGGRLERLNIDDFDGGAADAGDGLVLDSSNRAESAVDAATVDRALVRLEHLDPQQGKLVELRFFGGLSIEEAADVMGVSSATIKREWVFARAWFQRELGAGLLE